MFALRWAAEQDTGGPMPKLVLYALAEHANRQGRATTSIATLVRETEASERTVRRALATLADRRLIDRARRQRGTGADTSNAYQLNINSPHETDTVTPSPACHADHPNGQSDSPPLAERHPGSGTQTPHAGGTVTPQCEPKLQNPKPEPKSATPARAQATTTSIELAATAARPDAYRLVSTWRTETRAGYRPATIRALAKHADVLLRDGADPALVRVALDEWDRRPDARPGLFPHLYDDAVKAARRADQPRTNGSARSARGDKVRGWLALAAEQPAGTVERLAVEERESR